MGQLKVIARLLAVQLAAGLWLFILVLIASKWLEPPFADHWLLLGWLFGAALFSWPLKSLWRGVSLIIPLFVYGWFALAIAPIWGLVIALVLWLVYRNGAGHQVPFYRSSTDVITALRIWLDESSPRASGLRLADMGCGDGRLLFNLADHPVLSTLYGYETAWLPYWLARWRLFTWQKRHPGKSASKIQLVRQDFWQQDWGAFDLVYVYLSPAVMAKVAEKAGQGLQQQAWLVSYEFAISEQDCAAHHLTLTDVWELGETDPTRLYWYQKSV
ncbi:hypothetical protein THIAE_08930 [Thiomicrospira aerophila AL3]|uniref:Methyltransferase type 12 n=1 Tax=Thiomicrospira aerophila AL3 TaxID=717772 RepID=W0DZU4_9GAMM|nr:hypothetical protein [Thiomicrospira aerophila]AHF02371.1 hypothetical protein THIAE_08930 [Thiomicrospira aerophila AL3]